MTQPDTTAIDVVGIGNALVDVLTHTVGAVPKRFFDTFIAPSRATPAFTRSIRSGSGRAAQSTWACLARSTAALACWPLAAGRSA